jgi:hypothetical protein
VNCIGYLHIGQNQSDPAIRFNDRITVILANVKIAIRYATFLAHCPLKTENCLQDSLLLKYVIILFKIL